jgi:hypothetical protein
MGTMRLDLWRRTRRSAVDRVVEQVRPETASGTTHDARRPGALAPVIVSGRPAAPLVRLGSSR